jgi:NAD(P)-dependent dehydrogenase (short-subunit alcohol dehydrogenase family)
MTAQSRISLEGKVILVTGASRGIGEAISLACAEAGAKVVLASRKQPGLDEVAAKITAAGGECAAIAAHTGKPEQLDELFAKSIEKFGQVDGVVNNAATNPYFGPLVDIPEKAMDKTYEVNVKGYLFVAQRFVKHVRDRGGDSGAIVNVASVAGMRASPMQGFYGMTKAAVISLTQTLAYELGGSNIRINAIAPGLIETRFASAIVQNPQLRDHVVSRTPLARHGQPVEIAGGAVYLLSDASTFVSGHTMVIDGGLTTG